jgi:CheY-like chemotaxis protein
MSRNGRILIIDDNRAIHDDFRKILAPVPKSSVDLASLEDALFGESAPVQNSDDYHIASAYQGREGFDLVERAECEGAPYALAFVDVRMPPGWDGVETTKYLWQVSPRLRVVICTAFSDYSWEQISQHLGNNEQLVILRKPFDPVEVQQLTSKLLENWNGEES